MQSVVVSSLLWVCRAPWHTCDAVTLSNKQSQSSPSALPGFAVETQFKLVLVTIMAKQRRLKQISTIDVVLTAGSSLSLPPCYSWFQDGFSLRCHLERIAKFEGGFHRTEDFGIMLGVVVAGNLQTIRCLHPVFRQCITAQLVKGLVVSVVTGSAAVHCTSFHGPPLPPSVWCSGDGWS